MVQMKELMSLDEVDAFIMNNELAFLYITQPNCSVCHGLKPQLIPILEQYNQLATASIDSSQIPAIAGQLNIFTVPVALLFVNGKEYFRKARFIPLAELNDELERVYTNMVDEH